MLCFSWQNVHDKEVYPHEKAFYAPAGGAGAGARTGGCGGNVDNVEIVEWEPSEIYSDADIEAAFRTVENYFRREFKGCTLTQLYYVGDDHADEFARIADQYDSDVEAIVIGSSFDVDSSGGDGSLNPNSTYTRWEWILVRSSGGSWRHVDHGYG